MDIQGMALAALGMYGLEDAAATLIRHNENAVFRVEDAWGGAYVLRLHRTAAGIRADDAAQAVPARAAELRFLRLLAEDGLPVQRPVAMADGGDVAVLPGGAGCATLLRWAPGVPLREDDPDAEALAGAVGRLVARMHDFVVAHPETAALDRPAYDVARVERAMRAIQPGVAEGMFSGEMYADLLCGAEAICDAIRVAQAAPGQYGLIHADLGLGNLIVDGRTITPIDFSLCGHAPLLFDLGGLMGTFGRPALRRAALEGYAALRPLDETDFRATEAYFVLSICCFMAMHLRNPHVRGWFGRRLPDVIVEYVRPLARGEAFLDRLLAGVHGFR